MRRLLLILYNEFTLILWLFIWIAGAVIAKGFFSTLMAVVTCGAWSGYLVVERLMIQFHWLGM